MPKKKAARPLIYAIEPDSADIRVFVDKTKKKTGLSKRRIVTELIRYAMNNGVFA